MFVKFVDLLDIVVTANLRVTDALPTNAKCTRALATSQLQLFKRKSNRMKAFVCVWRGNH